jgi:hypothetical protein
MYYDTISLVAPQYNYFNASFRENLRILLKIKSPTMKKPDNGLIKTAMPDFPVPASINVM